MGIDFKSYVNSYFMFPEQSISPEEMFYSIRFAESEGEETVSSDSEEDAREFVEALDAAKIRRVFSTQIYKEFCLALAEACQKGRLRFDTQTNQVHWEGGI
jgi:hypothetical protein